MRPLRQSDPSSAGLWPCQGRLQSTDIADARGPAEFCNEKRVDGEHLTKAWIRSH